MALTLRALGGLTTREIAEGVRVLQSALALRTEARPPGRYQLEAAIAALHDDAASAEETDWPQILSWYDDLVALTDDRAGVGAQSSWAKERSSTPSASIVSITRGSQSVPTSTSRSRP